MKSLVAYVLVYVDCVCDEKELAAGAAEVAAPAVVI